MDKLVVLRRLSYNNFKQILTSLENELQIMKTASEPSRYLDEITEVIEEIRTKIDRLEKVKN